MPNPPEVPAMNGADDSFLLTGLLAVLALVYTIIYRMMLPFV